MADTIGTNTGDLKLTVYDKWQAPDRDSPGTIVFGGTPLTKLNENLDTLLRMDGANGMDEAEVLRTTGRDLSRPRRWHKIFERMGLMYRIGSVTHVSPLGRKLLDLDTRIQAEALSIPRDVAITVLDVLKKYQLKNPLDETEEARYPDNCTVHPYYAIWRAADELDGKLHWDELNRELMHIMRDEELEEIIDRIRSARAQADYDPEKGGSANVPLRDRCHEQSSAPTGKTPEGQIRDQKMTPFFRRAGFGGLLLTNPGATGGGYWSIPDNVRDLVHEAVATPPTFRVFNSVDDWSAYFFSCSEEPRPISRISDLDLSIIIDQLKNVAPDLVFADELVARLITSLNSSDRAHLVILRGVSGTGKTRLVSALARAVYADPSLHAPELTMIPVRPDWTDSAPLLGYFSPIERKYIRPLFLRTLIEADSNRNKPYFICLDEMNLARVEYYLAECLSAMESGEPIHIERQSDTTVPENLVWPANVYLFGTINIDESTQSISDKVLDRAQVIDTSDISLKPLLARWLENCSYLDAESRVIVEQILTDIWETLKLNNAHFGYRTAKAIIRYVDEAVGRTAGIVDLTTAIDSQIEQKILPKLRGEEDQWIDTLDNLIVQTSTYERTQRLLIKMRSDLERYGSFQFWG